MINNMMPTSKQQRFIDEYCIDQNATQAYKRAGYKSRSAKAAKSGGGRLYANPVIRAAIDARLRILAEETGITAKEIYAVMAAIVRGNICGFLVVTGALPRMMPANEIAKQAWTSAKSVKVKRYVEDETREVEIIEYKLESRVPPAVLLLKALGAMPAAKVEVTGKGGGPMEVKNHDAAEVIEALTELKDAIAAGAARLGLENGIPPDHPGEPVHPGPAPPV